MALPILDGNQSATTLSTILAGGEHTPAHTVVSLGSTAISNITSAVSGSVVSISNFPATQPISGSVSISGTPSVTFGQSSTTFGAVTGSVSVLNFPATQTIAGTVTANVPLLNNTAFYVSGADVDTIRTVIYSSANGDFGDDEGAPVDSLNPLPVFVKNEISGTVTVGNSVTIAGTVTANLADQQTDSGTPIFVAAYVNSPGGSAIPVSQDPGAGMPVSGTVIVGAMPNGSLTTRFGTPTTASVAFATTAVTNASRKYLLIQNVTTGSNVITVGIGFTPTTTQGIQLTAGAGITFESSYIPTGAVRILSSVTASNFTILEG